MARVVTKSLNFTECNIFLDTPRKICRLGVEEGKSYYDVTQRNNSQPRVRTTRLTAPMNCSPSGAAPYSVGQYPWGFFVK